jgi:hypothetical protein
MYVYPNPNAFFFFFVMRLFRPCAGRKLQGRVGWQTEADLETNTPPRSETVLMQAPCTSLSSGNDTKFMEVEAVDPQHGCSGYEPNQFRIYSNADPTSPVVNCIGPV